MIMANIEQLEADVARAEKRVEESLARHKRMLQVIVGSLILIVICLLGSLIMGDAANEVLNDPNGPVGIAGLIWVPGIFGWIGIRMVITMSRQEKLDKAEYRLADAKRRQKESA